LIWRDFTGVLEPLINLGIRFVSLDYDERTLPLCFMNTEDLIKVAFSEAVDSIGRTVTPTLRPHLYHEYATTHEINSVYHFAKAVEGNCSPCAVYFEYQCDSGRVDAVVVTDSACLLIEAKSRLDYGRIGSLQDQAARLGNSQDSLRRYLQERIPQFRKEAWNLETNNEIWGVLLAETSDECWRDVWRALSENPTYPALRMYRTLDLRNPVYTKEPWYHLLAFSRVG
jgi:hypothetical protein